MARRNCSPIIFQKETGQDIDDDGQKYLFHRWGCRHVVTKKTKRQTTVAAQEISLGGGFGWGSGFLDGDPGIDALLEDVHRKGTIAENFVVESADVELVAELILGVLAETENFQLADFVAESLTGPDNVAIGLGLNADFVFR